MCKQTQRAGFTSRTFDCAPRGCCVATVRTSTDVVVAENTGPPTAANPIAVSPRPPSVIEFLQLPSCLPLPLPNRLQQQQHFLWGTSSPSLRPLWSVGDECRLTHQIPESKVNIASCQCRGTLPSPQFSISQTRNRLPTTSVCLFHWSHLLYKMSLETWCPHGGLRVLILVLCGSVAHTEAPTHRKLVHVRVW